MIVRSFFTVCLRAGKLIYHKIHQLITRIYLYKIIGHAATQKIAARNVGDNTK